MSDCLCDCAQIMCVSAWLYIYLYIKENQTNYNQIYEDFESPKQE